MNPERRTIPDKLLETITPDDITAYQAKQNSPYRFRHEPDITAAEMAHVAKSIFGRIENDDVAMVEVLDSDGEVIAWIDIDERAGKVTGIEVDDVKLTVQQWILITDELIAMDAEGRGRALGDIRAENI